MNTWQRRAVVRLVAVVCGAWCMVYMYGVVMRRLVRMDLYCSTTLVEIEEQQLCSHTETTPHDASLRTSRPHYKTPCIVIPDTYLHPQPASANHVIAMSAWGNDTRYIDGIIQNAKLIAKHFPGWTLRVYTPAEERACDNSTAVRPMPQQYYRQLLQLKADIIYVNNTWCDIPPMMWRFLVADDMSVDHFIVRDADSRLSARDSAVVQAWLDSGSALHCARDHPSHANYPVSGGLWGGKPHQMRNTLNTSMAHLMLTHRYTDAYRQDMDFLGAHVWPAFAGGDAYCSDSVSCDRYPSSHPFPVPRVGYQHLGQVYTGDGVPRKGDIYIMCLSHLASNCVPKSIHESVQIRTT